MAHQQNISAQAVHRDNMFLVITGTTCSLRSLTAVVFGGTGCFLLFRSVCVLESDLANSKPPPRVKLEAAI
jgi:hypothetical protein